MLDGVIQEKVTVASLCPGVNAQTSSGRLISLTGPISEHHPNVSADSSSNEDFGILH